MGLHSIAKDQGQEAMIVRRESGIELSLYQKMRRFRYLIFEV